MREIQATVMKTVEKRTLLYTVSNRYLFLKRAFDIMASLFGIILLSPVFTAVSVAIKLDSKGPIFFKQKRNGYKGKVFEIYKFRSMVANADKLISELENKNEVSGHMFKIRNDPRITKIGKFLRKTSIDELPQLFNVLIGDMSLVGPRPPIIREVAKYDIWHNLRMSARPGITGLWQISGRNDIGFQEMVRLDLKYIKERSFLYDLKIIFKTIPVLFGDNKAF